jgi:hypothetical protein
VPFEGSDTDVRVTPCSRVTSQTIRSPAATFVKDTAIGEAVRFAPMSVTPCAFRVMAEDVAFNCKEKF